MIAVIIVVVLLVLAAFVLLVGVARRRDTGDAIGELSRETRRRDTGATVDLTEAAAPVTGREVEKAAVLERTGKAVVVAGASAPPAPWVAPDPETIGVTRRQFFNRSITIMFIVGLSGFGTAVIAFLWPNVSGGFGSKIRVGSRIASIDMLRSTRYGAPAKPFGGLRVVMRASMRSARCWRSSRVRRASSQGLMSSANTPVTDEMP